MEAWIRYESSCSRAKGGRNMTDDLFLYYTAFKALRMGCEMKKGPVLQE